MATTLVHSMVHHDVDLGDRERRHVENGVARLDTWTKNLPDRSLRITLGQRRKDNWSKVQLVLEIANKTIVAQDTAPTLLTAVDRAFRKASRQIKDFKALLRREHLHGRGRSNVRNFMPQMPESEVSAAARRRDLETFRLSVVHQLDRLAAHLEQELDGLRQSGRPVSTPTEDVVDEILAEALDRFEDKPLNLTSEEWLQHVATDVVERYGARKDTPTVALDDGGDVPEAPSSQDDPFDGLNRLHFRGELELDDRRMANEPRVRIGAIDDPSILAEEEDMKLRVAELLKELPAPWRRTFLLHVDGFDLDEIAQATQYDRDTARYNLRSAELFLRRRLAADFDLEVAQPS